VAKRADLLRRVLADCFCQLQPSPIHGVGVFAIRKIPKGRGPFRTLAKYATTGLVRVTEDERAALQPKLAALIRALFVPTADKLYVPTSGLNVIHLCAYINHATRPNLRTRDGARFITKREIDPGEELTVDYRTYGASILGLIQLA
jgi:SET domain-containing protein